MPETQPDLSHRAMMLLDFWFAQERASEHDRLRDIWFHATPEFDAAVMEHFRADYDRAAAGIYGPWRDTPQTCLALILLLDQLPRNLFRNSPQAYATDAAALETASEAVTRGYDRAVAPVRRCFFYLPFQHSESLADQDTGMRLYAGTPGQSGLCRGSAPSSRDHCPLQPLSTPKWCSRSTQHSRGTGFFGSRPARRFEYVSRTAQAMGDRALSTSSHRCSQG